MGTRGRAANTQSMHAHWYMERRLASSFQVLACDYAPTLASQTVGLVSVVSLVFRAYLRAFLR
jgi:hypothetical protein